MIKKIEVQKKRKKDKTNLIMIIHNEEQEEIYIQ